MDMKLAGISQPYLPATRVLSKMDQILLDLLVLMAAFGFAYLLRFDFDIPRHELFSCLVQLPCVVLIQLTILHLAGIYKFIWRYVGMTEVRSFIKAAVWSFVPLIVLRVFLPTEFQAWRVPVSIIVADTVLAFLGILGLRVLRRGIYERGERQQETIESANGNSKPILLVGAGQAGVTMAREIQRKGGMGLEIKGFIDDQPNLQNTVLSGIRVLGTTEDLPRLIKTLEIDHVVISIAAASRRDIRRILNICEQIPVKVRVIPSLHEIIQGNVKISRIRDVQIEDLLGREPVCLIEEDMLRLLAGKRIMVTGAGGSIGSELVRQVARHHPANVLLVERCEFALFNIEREIRETYPDLSVTPLVADVGDGRRMRNIFATYEPQVVVHAAAHKHVPMMELNPSEAVRNNVLATSSLGILAGEFEVETFVLISTDKAVRPTSVMGATKRVAELVIQDLNHRYATRYLGVRFGNVIGSAGSVIPIFREQIRNGGPIAVTHPDMIRYFMTIPEAAQLVLQAAALGHGGEIFILDMGEPVRILDVAKKIISLSGLKPFEDIDIVFTGIRPGEKMFEELELTGEQIAKTRHPKIFIGQITAYPEEQVAHALNTLEVLSKNSQEQELREFLNKLLPEGRLTVSGSSLASSEINKTAQKTAGPLLRLVQSDPQPNRSLRDNSQLKTVPLEENAAFAKVLSAEI